ncbi:glycosyltransferase family 2 protein [Cryobacterium sp. Y82]|uniref:glycosyltransferase family 2 protein n=1 Tax=Cryobacterium sp. Y82 TaxID=2045017 RepID=UPI000CE50C74|nr:glycosyltransferase family 2 protein [Cryobacterium sp. Y82]
MHNSLASVKVLSEELTIISVVIVTYNSQTVIQDCLLPLVGEKRIQLIIVDNASEDRTIPLVLSVAPLAVVIQNTENVGFGAAVNIGANAASGSYICLLNPDARAGSDALLSLAGVLDSDPDIGIVAPLVAAPDNEFQAIAAGRSPTKWRMFTHATGMSRFGMHTALFEGHYFFQDTVENWGRVDADWVSGACLIVRTDDWRSLEGLSDRWFMYGEDVELCLRFRALGMRVVISSEHHVKHAIGGSSSTVDGRMNPMWITNLYDLYSWRLSSSAIDALTWKGIVLAGFAGRILTFSIRSLMLPSSRNRSKWEIRRYVVYMRALAVQPRNLGRSRLRISSGRQMTEHLHGAA